MVCEQNVEENVYPEHMQTHGGVGNQLNAIKQKKEIESNTPKMIPLSKDDPIPLEMQEVLQAMDAPKPEPKGQIVEYSGKNPPIIVEQKPLKLKYLWEGNCPQDNAPVRTVITKVDGRWFCTAYCISHGELEQTEVTPLEEKKKFIIVDKDTLIVGEKEVKDERQSNVSKKSPK